MHDINDLRFGESLSKVNPVGSPKHNPSILVSYNSANEVVKIEKTIEGTTYTKTFTRSDNTVDHTLPISTWS